MILRHIGLGLLISLIALIGGLDTAFGQALSAQVQEEQAILQGQGFKEWQWMKTSCRNCEMILIPTQEEVRTEKVMLFIHALHAHKAELLKLYDVSSDEYNLLAHMSVGILGRESQFFKSKRYLLKEAMPWAVTLAKIMEIFLSGSNKELSENSRGPTQIKVIPEAIAEVYQMTPDMLYIPEHAALATMGFLIEALGELKRRAIANKLSFITPATYGDYLPYIYFGRTRALTNKTATPDQNHYVRAMKRYMSWFEVYEREIPLEPLVMK